MHYMIDPPTDHILRPALHVMDCELRDWACSFYMKTLTDFNYPRYMILLNIAKFEVDICGKTGRHLWIYIYDEISAHGYAEEQSDLFLEGFISAFGNPFWNLIPPSCDPIRDENEKQERMGVEISQQSESSKESLGGSPP